MEFKKLSVGKFSYGIDQPQCADAKEKDVCNFNFEDASFMPHMRDTKHENHENIKDYLTHLAVCHTVVADVKDGKTLYNASSPDELALVNAAKYFGYFFKGRDDDNNIEVEINGKRTLYQLLNVIEFSSDRKRMTVVVRLPDGRLKVMCKGADSIIAERLVQTEENLAIMKEEDKHLDKYACSGLRTLLLAEKEIS